MLPEPFHSDPADRIIVARAREYGAVLVTSDKKFSHIRMFSHCGKAASKDPPGLLYLTYCK